MDAAPSGGGDDRNADGCILAFQVPAVLKWQASNASPYRTFVREQMYSIVLWAALLNNFTISLGFVKANLFSGKFNAEFLLLVPYMAAYVGSAVVLYKRPRRMEVCIVAAILVRVALSSAVALGYFPIISFVRYMISNYIEIFNEAIVMPMTEPLPLSYLVPLRALLAFTFGGMYQKLGVRAPWMRGMLVHFSALLVGTLVELRFRHLYRLHLNRRQQQQHPKPKNISDPKEQQPKQHQAPPSSNTKPHQASLKDTKNRQAQPSSDTKRHQAPPASSVKQVPLFVQQQHQGQQLQQQQGKQLQQPRQGQQLQRQQQEEQPHQQQGQRLQLKSSFRSSLVTSADTPEYKSKMRKRRIVVTLQGEIKPEALTQGAAAGLKGMLEEHLPGIHLTGICLRQGCVVLAFDLCCLGDGRDGQAGEQEQQDARELESRILGVVRQWSEENNLHALGLDADQAAVSVQVCPSRQQPLHAPSQSELDPLAHAARGLEPQDLIIVMPTLPDSHNAKHVHLHKQQQQGSSVCFLHADQVVLQCPPEVEASIATVSVAMELHIKALPEWGVVRGWRGAEDSPEDLADNENCLCLLAATGGRYVPASIDNVEGKCAKVCGRQPRGSGRQRKLPVLVSRGGKRIHAAEH